MTERIPALKQGNARKSFRARRLIAIVIALFVIISIVLFFRSSLSKLTDIQVQGTIFVDPEDIQQALDVHTGDSFFFPSANVLRDRVLTLKQVESVSIQKRFPGVLRVKVKEFEAVAIQLSAEGQIASILSNGFIVPIREGSTPDKPILTGWQVDDANLIALCQVLNNLPSSMLSDLSEIHPDPSTSYPDRIKLYTRSRFEVITTVSKLSERISYLSDIVQNREPGKVIMLEANTYLSYSAESENEKSQEADKVEEKDTTQ
ncbi:MAG: FtsQ-type POTRA domain-containing protein [Candidatus Cohnella colombiensis]|uniref:FtsQ-type POTRA domain-containing protein n=1 Tax=Candidatus Cohnella colombiensis TaxID=3121368 RepID=A0AA95ETA1_9BACL|nr:MAG: FtsQ-type POTRA domain-containing protein [Cohnella sp.]